VRTIGTTIAASLLGLLAACSHDVQTTSGKSYLDGYRAAAAGAGDQIRVDKIDRTRSGAPQTMVQSSAAGASQQPAMQPDVDAMVVKAAMVEPLIRFPARIGVVRLKGGQRASVPEGEGPAWIELARNVREEIGELIPLNHMLADATASSVGFSPSGMTTLEREIAKIRIGAARQHLDAVIIYEASANSKSERSFASLIDLTLVGYFLVPTRIVEADATATAIIMDVRNGYMYGNVTATAEKTGLSYATSTFQARSEAEEKAVSKATGNLTQEIGKALFKLKRDLLVKRAVVPS